MTFSELAVHVPVYKALDVETKTETPGFETESKAEAVASETKDKTEAVYLETKAKAQGTYLILLTDCLSLTASK